MVRVVSSPGIDLYNERHDSMKKNVLKLTSTRVYLRLTLKEGHSYAALIMLEFLTSF